MRPLKLTLAKKMLIGFSVMVLLTVAAGSYAIVSLNRLSSLSRHVVEEDLPLIETSTNLTESFLAQDLYAERFLILRDPKIKALFLERSDEFKARLQNLNPANPGHQLLKEQIDRFHQEYDELFKKQTQFLERQRGSVVTTTDAVAFKAKSDQVLSLLRQMQRQARADQKEKTILTSRSSGRAFQITVILAALSIFFGLGFTIYLNFHLSSSMRQLKEATHLIGQGRFDRVPTIKATDDEVGDLAESFKWMTKRLQELEEINLDANPLTRLPGNLAIERALLLRLKEGASFAFCLIDLDNFKAFGDRYGYARGSEVLKKVSRIMIRTVQTLGNKGDFIGHIGGDDFVLITEPVRVEKLCEMIIKEFDEAIPDFYDGEDRKRGYIISKDRRDVEQTFPLMTLSIAVVTNQRRQINTPMQVAEIAAQLKQYAKTFPRSIYVVDQRRNS
jgi:GGDEF domain-containing protein/CHASE3 domain sensor protein